MPVFRSTAVSFETRSRFLSARCASKCFPSASTRHVSSASARSSFRRSSSSWSACMVAGCLVVVDLCRNHTAEATSCRLPCYPHPRKSGILTGGGSPVSHFRAEGDKENYAIFSDFGQIRLSVLVVLIEHPIRSEEHTSELQSLRHLVCRL